MATKKIKPKTIKSVNKKDKLMKNKESKKLYALMLGNGKLKTKKSVKFIRGILVIGLGITTMMAVNQYIAMIKNQTPPPNNNFENSEIVEDFTGDNDIEFDENGAIIVDKTVLKEKQVLVDNFNNKILTDVNKRQTEKIDKIDKILSIQQLPCNMNEDDNMYDKYQLSIIFEANGQIYTMNYLTGDELNFEQNTLDKQKIGNFMLYLDNAAIDSCIPMDDPVKIQIKDILKNSQENPKGEPVYIGESYFAYKDSGDEFYNIPVFFKDTNNQIYSVIYQALATQIDAYELDPIEALKQQLEKSDESKKYFEEIIVKNDEDFTTVINIIEQYKKDIENSIIENENDDNEEMNKE